MKLLTKIFLIFIPLLLIPNRTVYNYSIGEGSSFLNEEVGRKIELSNKKMYNPGARWEYKNFTIEKTKPLNLDWRLIWAIIKQESQFDPNAVSARGAQGLMQIHPSTQQDFGMDSLDVFEPMRNIDVGVSYFSKLYSLFEKANEADRICLALAAYNAGPSRIYDAQELVAYLGEDPLSWRAIQNALPLLSKRYYTLHRSVWDGGKPRYGYFGGWRQTISYVENVLKYQKLFN